MMAINQWLGLLLYMLLAGGGNAMLYPRESESREVKELSGRWKFRIDDSANRNRSFENQWWLQPLHTTGPVIDMPVPASYNDITQNKTIRDFVGWVWYETRFFVPSSWNDGREIWLRVGSAHYTAIVYLNSVKVMEHSGGHLPFECEVKQHLNFGAENRLTVAVNNTLTSHTLPPGNIHRYSTSKGYPSGYFTLDYQFDFFNYAGIHRPVKLYTTPQLHIRDISTYTEVETDLVNSVLHYNITVASSTEANLNYNVSVILKNAEGETVAIGSGLKGHLNLTNQNLWWPVGMNKTVGYLHSLEVNVISLDDKLSPTQRDVYRLPVGIRTVEATTTTFLINKRPFYFLGVGKHEDWNVRGKGFDWSMVTKDFELLEWLGANSFRTSHYPYAEEIMQMCDERGIVVIDECPAVGMRSAGNFANQTLAHHLEVVGELISRDRNHPSVVMWSMANEPLSSLPEAANYFKTVIDHAKVLDPTRPVTFVCNAAYDKDVATPYVDVVSINKYEGWYNDPGHPEVIEGTLSNYIKEWYQTRSKPIIHMEWGAGAIAGFHANPPVMYTEDYLVEVMKEHFEVFDAFRNETPSYLVGEMIWNFADFATAQTANRAYGNRKGLFTRERQPKWPAYIIRERYSKLRSEVYQTRKITFSNNKEQTEYNSAYENMLEVIMV